MWLTGIETLVQIERECTEEIDLNSCRLLVYSSPVIVHNTDVYALITETSIYACLKAFCAAQERSAGE